MDSHLPMAFGAIEDPVTFEERRKMAEYSSSELGMTMPSLVDNLDDEVGKAYLAWPERLYLVGADGKLTFRCGPGPFGFDPDGLEDAIRDLLD